MDGTHRTKKRAAAILLGFFAAAAIAMPSAQAADRTVSELIPVGQTVGVKLFSDGVLVVGFSDGESPAKDCGLKEGDVITFMVSEDTLATHRIVGVVPDEDEPGTIRFRTKGDANDAEDGTLVHYKNVVGTPVFTIPYLGYFSNWITHAPGKYIAITAAVVFGFLCALVAKPGDKS